MSPDAVTTLFNYGVPLGLLILALVYGVPYATRKLDQVLADHAAAISKLIATNDQQRAEHLAFEQQQRVDYLNSLRATQDKQNSLLLELVSLTKTTNGMIEELHNDFRSWNGIERRRVRTNRKVAE